MNHTPNTSCVFLCRIQHPTDVITRSFLSFSADDPQDDVEDVCALVCRLQIIISYHFSQSSQSVYEGWGEGAPIDALPMRFPVEPRVQTLCYYARYSTPGHYSFKQLREEPRQKSSGAFVTHATRRRTRMNEGCKGTGIWSRLDSCTRWKMMIYAQFIPCGAGGEGRGETRPHVYKCIIIL